MVTLILRQNSKKLHFFWSGVEFCGVEWCIGAYNNRRFSKKNIYPQLGKLYRVIQKNACKIDIFDFDTGIFDTRLKILTLALNVTIMRYVSPRLLDVLI